MALTTEEQMLLEGSLKITLRLLTKAGVVFWEKYEQACVSDICRYAVGEIEEDEMSTPPMFVANINIHAGVLEEITTLARLNTDDESGTEVGMKVSLASYENDDADEARGEVTINVDLDLLADIDRSVREREERLAWLMESFKREDRNA